MVVVYLAVDRNDDKQIEIIQKMEWTDESRVFVNVWFIVSSEYNDLEDGRIPIKWNHVY